MTRRGRSVTIAIAVPGEPDLAVILTPRDGKPAFVETRHLSIRYAGDALKPRHEEALKLVAGGLRDATFDAIVSKLPEMPEAGPETPTAGGPPDADRSHEVVTVDEWGSPDRWRTFIFRREFARNASSAIRLTGPRVITVSHGESECRYATPQIDGRTVSLYNYPWVRPLEAAGRPEGRRGGVGDEIPCYFSTDLRDVDIITGGTAKLRAVLDRLAASTVDTDVVVVKSTCVPHVIGDDMEGAVARWRGKGRIRYDDVFAPAENDLTAELFAAAIDKGRGRRRSRGPLMNLAGIAVSPALAEIEALLGAAGISVNCALIPEIDLVAAERWRDAPCQVLLPNPYYAPLYKKVLLPLPLDTLTPAAPYGVAAAEAWFGRVGSASARASAVKTVLRNRRAELGPSIDSLRRSAAAARLGFVIDDTSYLTLCDPSASAGIPVLDVAVELGFGIDFLVYAPSGAAPAVPPLRPAHAAAAAVHHFSDPESLEKSMRSAPCTAVYSDLYGDERITSAGKTPFSLQFFEPGLEGAVRTAERLVGACANTFFGRYGRHARRT
ncbi:MAG: hypothetical protein HY897_10960 [Deltaproteobacteria bacterium]|nr:hypothetical protein [Deltaproteobacteria bacterium]